MPPRKLSTNAFGLGEIREEDEPFDESIEKVAADIEAEAETEELLAEDNRPVYRLLREKEEWVDKGLETAYKDGYTEIIGGVSYHAPFFYIITKRDVTA